MEDKIYRVTDMAKMLKTASKGRLSLNPQKLNEFMKDLGIQTKVNGELWQPTGDYMEYGVLTIRERNGENFNYYRWKGEMVGIILSRIDSRAQELL